MPDKTPSKPPAKIATASRQTVLPIASWSRINRMPPDIASAVDNARLLEIVSALCGFSKALDKQENGRRIAAFDTLEGMAPRDPFEFHLAEMMIASRAAAMANLANAHDVGLCSPLGLAYQAASKSMSGHYAELLGAWDKHRGREAQKYIVEHVHAVRGDQAVDDVPKNGSGRRRKSSGK